jgi:hypothetical protein
MEYGIISTSLIMEEPVVVKPEADSKNASINDGIVLLIRYGKVPNREKTIHEITTARYPSLLLNLSASAFLPVRKKSPEIVRDNEAENRKGERGSLYISETGMQNRYANVSISSILLNILRINSGFINFITGVREF